MSTNSQTTQPRRSFEAWLTDFIAGLVPWLAPIPSAVLVANATLKHLGWSQPVAVVAGLIIEGLGLTSTSTALTLWDWNARRPSNEPKAPFWLAGLMVAVYLISTIGLTVVLDFDVALVHIAPALFPILALVGTINIALRSQHKHRLARIADYERQAHDAKEKAEQERKAEEERRRQERREAREAKRLAIVQQRVNEPSIDGSMDTNQALLQAGRAAKKTSNMDRMLDIFKTDPHAGITDVARQVGIGRQTVYNYLYELEQAGRVHVNGNGVEVLP
jgi:hypothetical protein